MRPALRPTGVILSSSRSLSSRTGPWCRAAPGAVAGVWAGQNQQRGKEPALPSFFFFFRISFKAAVFPCTRSWLVVESPGLAAPGPQNALSEHQHAGPRGWGAPSSLHPQCAWPPKTVQAVPRAAPGASYGSYGSRSPSQGPALHPAHCPTASKETAKIRHSNQCPDGNYFYFV